MKRKKKLYKHLTIRFTLKTPVNESDALDILDNIVSVIDDNHGLDAFPSPLDNIIDTEWRRRKK